MSEVHSNLEKVRAEIADAARRVGRDPGSVTLVAVTKTVPIEKIVEAMALGHMVFGENYVQEACRKVAHFHDIGSALPRLHAIGPLQRNKVKDAVAIFELIQTVASIPLATAIATSAKRSGKVQDVLVQVNISREASKSGVAPEEAKVLCEAIAMMEGIRLSGLMTIGSLASNQGAAQARAEFRALRMLRDEIASALSLQLPQLSMGMSDDFEVAIEEGATIVRVGSAIFGERTRHRKGD